MRVLYTNHHLFESVVHQGSLARIIIGYSSQDGCSHKVHYICNSIWYTVILNSDKRSESKYTSNSLATIQVVCFLAQDIRSEFPKSRLDPRLTFGIP